MEAKNIINFHILLFKNRFTVFFLYNEIHVFSDRLRLRHKHNNNKKLMRFFSYCSRLNVDRFGDVVFIRVNVRESRIDKNVEPDQASKLKTHPKFSSYSDYYFYYTRIKTDTCRFLQM